MQNENERSRDRRSYSDREDENKRRPEQDNYYNQPGRNEERDYNRNAYQDQERYNENADNRYGGNGRGNQRWGNDQDYNDRNSYRNGGNYQDYNRSYTYGVQQRPDRDYYREDNRPSQGRSDYENRQNNYPSAHSDERYRENEDRYNGGRRNQNNNEWEEYNRPNANWRANEDMYGNRQDSDKQGITSEYRNSGTYGSQGTYGAQYSDIETPTRTRQQNNQEQDSQGQRGASKTTAQEQEPEQKPVENLNDLFVEQLQGLYSVENQLVEALPKMVQKMQNAKLKKAVKKHLEETKKHVERLDQVFEKLGAEKEQKTCKPMKDMIDGASKFMQRNQTGNLMDAGLIADAQKVEHFEMAGYGTVVAFAKQLGHDYLAELLQQTLDEEKNADSTLSEIAETVVNVKAENAQ